MSQFCIAFYNLENLFDTVNDPLTLDDDFTESSDRRWNEKRLNKKLKKLGRVISSIGYQDIGHCPVILGIAEVENEEVIRRLTQSKFLRKKGYDLVHFDSPDERGIDTALIYRSRFFRVEEQQVHTLHLVNDRGQRDFTRDILHVQGILNGYRLHVLVNHWPSRRAGVELTEPRRIDAANRNLEVIESIRRDDPDARIIVMGDLNDDPHSPSVQTLTDNDLYNPMEELHRRGLGSLNYQDNWNLFDQILMSPNLQHPHPNPFRFREAHIHSPQDIREFRGRFKGNPFRTFAGRRYLGGFSDHFPVYTLFDLREDR